MGNSYQCQEPATCNLISSSHQSKRTASALLNKSSSCSQINNLGVNLDKMVHLNQLSSTLKIHQCFYTLSTLMQQYYSLYKRYGKAVVTIDFCFVNQLGEVKVHFENVDLPAYQSSKQFISNNLVSIISRILQIVKSLALQRQWAQNVESSYFHDKFLKIIYRYHQNDQVLYHELMNQVYDYIQFNQIKCNLLGALIRYNTPIQQPLLQPKNRHKRYDSQSIKSFARQDSQLGFKNTDFLSKTAFTKNMNSSKFGSNLNERYDNMENTVYHRKVAKTEGQEYYQQACKNHERSQPNLKPMEILQSNKNYISSQYSMNIASIYNKEAPQSKGKVRFKKFTQKMRYEKEEDHEKILKRNNTVNNLGQKQNKSYTKSVLEDLARSVEVRDEPSSKSLIF